MHRTFVQVEDASVFNLYQQHWLIAGARRVIQFADDPTLCFSERTLPVDEGRVIAFLTKQLYSIVQQLQSQN